MASDTREVQPWCKIIVSPRHGDVLVTRNYEEDDAGSGEGDEKVNIEFRSNISLVITWSFLTEEEAQAAFNKLDASNIDTLRAAKIMDRFSETTIEA